MSRNKSLPNRYSQLQSLVEKRKSLFHSNKFSNIENGASIIITSGESREDREVLEEHAERINSSDGKVFYGAEILSQPSKKQVEEVILDKNVSNISFLGDGNFGLINLYQRRSDSYERISWYNLGKIATHLKSGIIEQRTCTRIRNPHEEVRVALGSIIVSDQTNLIGTVDLAFANHNGFEEFNSQLKQLYPRIHNTAEQLRRPDGFIL